MDDDVLELRAKADEAIKRNNYILKSDIEEIFKKTDKVTIECWEHGESTRSVKCLINGIACNRCNRIEAFKKISQRSLKDRQESLFSRALKVCEEKQYILLTSKEDIVNNSTYIEYNCSIHGTHKMKIANLLSGKGCPECGIDLLHKKFKLSLEELQKRVDEIDATVLNLDEYVNAGTKNLKCVCPECGEIFLSSFQVLTQRGGGQRCPECTKLESKGELTVKKVLRKLEIDFEQQKWWSDCRDKKPMPFDFYLPKYNLVCEVNGSQHYYDKNGFSQGLEYIQRHDKMKYDYCVENEINYMVIKHFQVHRAEQMILDKIKEIEDNTHNDIV